MSTEKNKSKDEWLTAILYGVVRPTPRNLYGLKITPAKTASKSIGLRMSLNA